MKKKITLVLIIVYYLLCITMFMYNWDTMIHLVIFGIALVFPIVLFLRLPIFENIMRNIRGKYWNYMTKSKAINLKIGKNIVISHPEQIRFGNNCSIGQGVEFFPLLEIAGIFYNGKMTIGNGVVIGDYNRFAFKDEIVIEDNVLFAAYVHITDHSHEFRNIAKPIIRQGVFGKGRVTIKEGTWLGYRAEILSGVTIGKNCVVAAGAVVTKDVPDYTVVAGCPAKIIKKYDTKANRWVNVNE